MADSKTIRNIEQPRRTVAAAVSLPQNVPVEATSLVNTRKTERLKRRTQPPAETTATSV